MEHMPLLVQRLLLSRGINQQEQVNDLIAPSLKSLRDPLVLDDMSKSIERLISAFRSQEHIAVYADFDLDGTTGLALLTKALKDFGYNNIFGYQPARLAQGYGFHKEAVSELKSKNVSLIITVDVGITAVETCHFAKENGIDVIITDHHLPKEELPLAYAIVNPNKGNCTSGLGHLSGVGVAFYLVMALKRELEKQNLISTGYDIKGLLDCFVIGTLTDMVPLKEENRVLVKHGLLQLERSQRPGLKWLMKRLNIEGRRLTSSDVAITIAPKLNALSRMELGLKPSDVLTVSDDTNAQQMVEEMLNHNELRKSLQKEAAEEAVKRVEGKLDQGFALVFDPSFHKGVVGLIATQIAKTYGVPALIGYEDETGMIHGSARLPESSQVSLVDWFQSAHDLFVRFGGHKAAAGFLVHKDNAEALRERLKESLNDFALSQNITKYDCEAQLSEINSEFMSWYEKLEPFGRDFPSALLRVSKAQISEVRQLKGGHIKLKLSEKSYEAEAIWFGPPSDSSFQVGDTVDLLIEPGWNHYKGSRRLQLLIKGLARDH